MLNPLSIAWAGLYAEDFNALIAFYENTLGLKLLERGERFALLDAGGGALFEIWGRGFSSTGRKTPRRQSVFIGFLVEHLEPAVEALKSRGLVADGEIGSHAGTRWIHYTDPEGNRFELKDMRG